MNADSQPCLASHVRLRQDPVEGTPILLYPEGVLQLSATAMAMLELCDSMRTVRQIAEILSLRFEASTDEIEADLIEFLDGLASRGFLA